MPGCQHWEEAKEVEEAPGFHAARDQLADARSNSALANAGSSSSTPAASAHHAPRSLTTLGESHSSQIPGPPVEKRTSIDVKPLADAVTPTSRAVAR